MIRHGHTTHTFERHETYIAHSATYLFDLSAKLFGRREKLPSDFLKVILRLFNGDQLLREGNLDQSTKFLFTLTNILILQPTNGMLALYHSTFHLGF